MRLIIGLFGALTLLAVSGCGPNVEAIYATKMALTAAEKAATVYIRLPLCPQSSGLMCSNAATSAKIKAADNIAIGAVRGLSDGKITQADAIAAVTGLTVLIPVQ